MNDNHIRFNLIWREEKQRKAKDEASEHIGEYFML